MGRYSVDALKNYNPQQFGGCPTHQPQQSMDQSNWPTHFPKGVVGLDRDGTINEDMGEYITNSSQLKIMPSSLEAIRTIRLKGHKLVILTNQAGVNKGIQTQAQVDAVNQTMMRVFGENGIFSIDGLYYATSNLKEDYYAKPNVGMFKRAQEEIAGIDWNSGWYVGDKITDLKAAEKVGATPILVLTGHGKETLKKLDTFANKDLKKKTKVFNNLLEFANSL
jgi:D-glycero-D-manno-heptose 1,7-bisphosphate phosphatase